jgi:GST-like protein
VLEKRLGDRPWLMGDEYSIADVQTFPWVRNMRGFYEATELLGLQNFPKTYAWVDRAAARPASVKGLEIPARG